MQHNVAIDVRMCVDLRVCQTYQDRGIPAYCQNLVLALHNQLPHLEMLFWYDPTLPMPTRSTELSKIGTLLTDKELANLPTGLNISHLLTTCFFVNSKIPLAKHLYPYWLRTHQPKRFGIIYDIIPYLFKDKYLQDPCTQNWYHEGIKLVRSWDKLFAISESCRNDLIKCLGINPNTTFNIGGGIDPSKIEAILAAPSNSTPTDSSYIIYIGGDDWRKNIEGAIQGFAHYKNNGGQIPVLVIACSMSPQRINHYHEYSNSLGLAPNSVVMTGHLTDLDLMTLLKNAETSIFPSFYEGLGLPILESYACNTPVLASANSSIIELVPPECLFDPSNPEDIAKSLLNFDANPAIKSLSLNAGSSILKKFTWESCAKQFTDYAFLDSPSKKKPGTTVAMVGILPPAESGIASFNLKHMSLPNKPVHFFAPFTRSTHFKKFSDRWTHLASTRNLPLMQGALNYNHRLFVFGNSHHNLPVLEALLSLRHATGKTWIYLHDIELIGLWLSYLNNDLQLVHKLYSRHYPGWKGKPSDILKPDRPRGVRPLLSLGKNTGIIVNSTHAKEMLKSDLAEAPSLGIHVLFLPSEVPAVLPHKKQNDILRVGTFGIPAKIKQIDCIIEAVKYINDYQPAELVIAGYGAKYFMSSRNHKDTVFIKVIDGPSDDDLIEAMNSVDVAVQLRHHSNGESSAIVSSLLGLGIPTIVTGAGSFLDLKEVTFQVTPQISGSELAEVILQVSKNKSLSEAAIKHARSKSSERFVTELERILNE